MQVEWIEEAIRLVNLLHSGALISTVRGRSLAGHSTHAARGTALRVELGL
jgi:hypothetical protein